MKDPISRNQDDSLRRTQLRRRSISAALARGLVLLALSAGSTIAQDASLDRSAPLPFGGGLVENHGQWNAGIRAAGWASAGEGLAVGLTEGGLRLILRGADKDLAVDLRPTDSSDSANWVLEAPLPGRHHYLVGGCEGGTELVPYSAARLGSGRLLLKTPGSRNWSWTSTNPQAEFRLTGARIQGLAADGAAVLEHAGDRWLLPPPGVGPRSRGRWIVAAEGRLRLVPGAPIAPLAMVGEPSPSIDWATYLGALSSGDEGRGADYDSLDRPLTCGKTESTLFPTAVGPFLNSPGGAEDGFLTKLSADGSSLVFSTYIGGSAKDRCVAVDIGSGDEIALMALTRSADFPVTPGAYDPVGDTAPGQTWAGALLRLQPDGSALIFSTFYGNALGDGLHRFQVLLADDGTLLACGETGGTPITPESAFGTKQHGSFLGKVSADGGELLFSTSPPCDPEIAVRSDGTIVVAGDGGFIGPWGTPGAYQEQAGGNVSFDAWVGIVSPDGRDLIAGTYLGGGLDDVCRGVAVDAQDRVLIAAGTRSPTFPQIGTPFTATADPTLDSSVAYLARLSEDLSVLDFTVLLGDEAGAGAAAWQGLTTDASGVVTLVGWHALPQPSWLTAGSHLEENEIGCSSICATGLVTRIAPDGSRVLYGSMIEWLEPLMSGIREPALASNPRIALLSGTVNGAIDLYPTTAGAFAPDCEFLCGDEAHLTQFNFLHEGVEALGLGGESCLGVISLNTTRRADVGAPEFAFYVSQAPPSAFGVLLIGGELPVPLPFGAQDLWIDPAKLVSVLPMTTQDSGYGVLDLGIPGGASGKTFAAQAAFLGTSECGPTGEFVLSEALRVLVP